MEITSTYFAGALLSMLVWWLEQGMPYSSQQMEDMMLLMFQSSIKALRSET